MMPARLLVRDGRPGRLDPGVAIHEATQVVRVRAQTDLLLHDARDPVARLAEEVVLGVHRLAQADAHALRQVHRASQNRRLAETDQGLHAVADDEAPVQTEDEPRHRHRLPAPQLAAHRAESEHRPTSQRSEVVVAPGAVVIDPRSGGVHHGVPVEDDPQREVGVLGVAQRAAGSELVIEAPDRKPDGSPDGHRCTDADVDPVVRHLPLTQ